MGRESRLLLLNPRGRPGPAPSSGGTASVGLAPGGGDPTNPSSPPPSVGLAAEAEEEERRRCCWCCGWGGSVLLRLARREASMAWCRRRERRASCLAWVHGVSKQNERTWSSKQLEPFVRSTQGKLTSQGSGYRIQHSAISTSSPSLPSAPPNPTAAKSSLSCDTALAVGGPDAGGCGCSAACPCCSSSGACVAAAPLQSPPVGAAAERGCAPAETPFR